jgi:hypothetical protein
MIFCGYPLVRNPKVQRCAGVWLGSTVDVDDGDLTGEMYLPLPLGGDLTDLTVHSGEILDQTQSMTFSSISSNES